MSTLCSSSTFLAEILSFAIRFPFWGVLLLSNWVVYHFGSFEMISVHLYQKLLLAHFSPVFLFPFFMKKEPEREICKCCFFFFWKNKTLPFVCTDYVFLHFFCSHILSRLLTILFLFFHFCVFLVVGAIFLCFYCWSVLPFFWLLNAGLLRPEILLAFSFCCVVFLSPFVCLSHFWRAVPFFHPPPAYTLPFFGDTRLRYDEFSPLRLCVGGALTLVGFPPTAPTTTSRPSGNLFSHRGVKKNSSRFPIDFYPCVLRPTRTLPSTKNGKKRIWKENESRQLLP